MSRTSNWAVLILSITVLAESYVSSRLNRRIEDLERNFVQLSKLYIKIGTDFNEVLELTNRLNAITDARLKILEKAPANAPPVPARIANN